MKRLYVICVLLVLILFPTMAFAQGKENYIAKISLDADAIAKTYPYYVSDPNRTIGKIFYVDKMDVIFDVKICSAIHDSIAIPVNADKIAQVMKAIVLQHPDHLENEPVGECDIEILSVEYAKELAVNNEKVLVPSPDYGVLIKFKAIPKQGVFTDGTFKFNVEMPIEYKGETLILTPYEPINFGIRTKIVTDADQISYNDHMFAKTFYSFNKPPDYLEIAERYLRENLVIDPKDGASLARLAHVRCFTDYEEACKLYKRVVQLLESGESTRIAVADMPRQMFGKTEILNYFKDRVQEFEEKARIAKEIQEKQKLKEKKGNRNNIDDDKFKENNSGAENRNEKQASPDENAGYVKKPVLIWTVLAIVIILGLLILYFIRKKPIR